MSLAYEFDDDAGLDVTNIGVVRLDDQSVRFAVNVRNKMNVLPELRGWREAERQRLGRHAGGAPERLPPEALWTAMILAAVHNLPLLATTFVAILFKSISPEMRTELGVPEPPADEDRKAWKALERCVCRRFHGLLHAIDPSPLPKNRRLSPEEFDAWVAEYREEHQLTDEVLAKRYERLAWVANAIIEASLCVIPRKLRRHWNGSVAVDATEVPAFARIEERDKTKRKWKDRAIVKHSTDPDADLFVRTGDDTPGTKNYSKPPEWAYEATIVVAANDDPETDRPFPILVVGMAPLHKPGHEPGANAIVALNSIVARGHPTRSLAGDRAYSNSKAENFQLRARALGYELVLDYRDDQLGIQDSYAGALMIEGAWYSPAIPDRLINATKDHRAKKIDDDTYAKFIEARKGYRLRPKANPDAEGHLRQLCPAGGTCPTAECENKPQSISPTSEGKLQIQPKPELRQNPPKICVQQSVTFPPEAGAKLLQSLHFGSPEWEAVYHALRNSIEGENGVAKNGALAALANPDRRRIRGVAAGTIFVALLLMATNIQQYQSFLANSELDDEGVRRRPSTRRRETASIRDWKPKPSGPDPPP